METPPIPKGFRLVEEEIAPPIPEGFRIAEQESPPRATLTQRAGALTTGVNRGIAALAGLPMDTAVNVRDLMAAGVGYTVSKITGKAPPAWLDPLDRARVWGASENIAGLMDKTPATTTQMPRPDDRVSQYLYAGGSAIPSIVALRPATVGQAAQQAGMAAGLGMVPQAVKDAGGSDVAGMGAAMAASMAVPGMVAITRVARASAQPLTTVGQRQIAGAAIKNAANNPAVAMRNMEDPRQFVAGSNPTAGQVSRDPGIANFENRLRALNPSAFSGRISQQNEARQKLLDTIAKGGQPEAIAAMESRRDAITSGLRDRAWQQAEGKSVPTQKVVGEIDRLLSDPENAGRSVQQALKAVRDQMFGSTGNVMTDAKQLYAVRKEINRVLEGKYVDANESVLRYAGGQLKGVRSAIDEAISEVAPDWNQYLTKYAQLSRPIDRAKEVNSIRQRTNLSAPDIETGREFLSQPKWKNVVSKNIGDLSKLMTKGQIQKMQMIAADLDRGASAVSSSSIRVPGSDTAANLVARGNLSVANIIGRTLGKSQKDLPPALANLSRPMSWLYSLPDAQIQQVIVDGLLDPKLGAQLMREGTIDNIQALSDSFRKQAEISGIIVAERAGANRD